MSSVSAVHSLVAFYGNHGTKRECFYIVLDTTGDMRKKFFFFWQKASWLFDVYLSAVKYKYQLSALSIKVLC
jgi:hypothetical protein